MPSFTNIAPKKFCEKFENVYRQAYPKLFQTFYKQLPRLKFLPQMNKLQVEIDEENETRSELYEQRSQAKEKKQKAAIESLLVS